jgi:hypothetical protein
MKKKQFLIVSVLVAVLLIVGCSSTPKENVYDKSVPLEQSSKLIILVNCSVLEFNGKNTDINWHADNSILSKIMIIPAGTHSLKLYSRNMSYETVFDPITREFLPGHSYVVTAEGIGRSFKAAIVDQADLNYELVPDLTRENASPFEGTWVSIKNEGDRLIFSKKEFFALTKKAQLRGTFSYTKEAITLNVTAIDGRNGLGWLPAINPLQYQLVNNVTTLKLKGLFFFFEKDMEFRRAQ